MKAKAVARLKFSSEKQLKTTLHSLKPETKRPATKRSQTSVAGEGKFLTLRFEAQDTVALRSSLNTYLRWIDSLLNVFEVLETQ